MVIVTASELEALAAEVPAPNDDILFRAGTYLRRGRERNNVETAHNLVVDVAGNLALNELPVPELLMTYEHDLRDERVRAYGSVGRPHDFTPPAWRRGW